MVFSYYHHLSPRMQSIYRSSDRVTEVRLDAETTQALRAQAADMEQVLKTAKRASVCQLCQRLADTLTDSLGIAQVQIQVLSSRPRKSDCELYGLYEHAAQPNETSRIRLWMRTAHHKRVVAFKTFLRTLLHELCHHLDFEFHRLPDSLHTEGFFKRESSLYRLLLPTT